ncbi:AAA family ATPase [Xenorhabdus griffiniae]|uniref:AAA family ATPase n=1 Tax=Xenorhabdus griffiniae TaxID=351672 RepID=A0ABY9XJV8_9GAMM|nr:AAA family ATPase [Xenorhabdus griffiniae]MBD1227133.1 AAA family ATPase [Xenorhabdus griffiniae]MBE8586503.1 AAA family ATPase [Xenorhabdus griffiniae]WMV73120.1 AAA family ATPase [Xenorhabdus griffiniae]WNH02799.1 AAA family ATPase [Xenorhabdus griffiniae]
MDWVFSHHKSWDYLSSTFSFIADMAGVQQDPIHHAEGDVAIHTQMVLAALEQLPEYSLLVPEEQEILWAAALLHDVEKRNTTRVDWDGRIISPGHARKGELTTRQILFQQIPTPFAIREQIAALVRFHGLPLWLMEKPNPQKALLAASLRVDTYLLALLAKADVLGRICHDAQELLGRIELFELYCREQGCWREPRGFSSSDACFHYFSTESEQPNYQPYDNYGSQVTLLCGLPGMGKDHFIQRHGQGMPVISLDTIRRDHQISPEDKKANGWVVQQAKQQAKDKLRSRQDFIWNATNLTRQMRQQLINLFVSYGARVRLVYIEQDYQRWRRQNRDRQYAVPDKVMDRMLGKLEVPTPEEAHEVGYFVDSEMLNR